MPVALPAPGFDGLRAIADTVKSLNIMLDCNGQCKEVHYEQKRAIYFGVHTKPYYLSSHDTRKINQPYYLIKLRVRNAFHLLVTLRQFNAGIHLDVDGCMPTATVSAKRCIMNRNAAIYFGVHTRPYYLSSHDTRKINQPYYLIKLRVRNAFHLLVTLRQFNAGIHLDVDGCMPRGWVVARCVRPPIR